MEGLELDAEQKRTEELLQIWRTSLPAQEASPHLKTRVGAAFDEYHRAKRRPLWPRLLLGLSGASALVLLGVGLGQFWHRDGFSAQIEHPVEVSIQISEAGNAKIARATVELPLGVQFFAEPNPSTSEAARIEFASRVAQIHTLEFELAASGEPIPVVIKGLSPGIKKIRIRFYDDHGTIVAEREKSIQFTAEKSGVL